MTVATAIRGSIAVPGNKTRDVTCVQGFGDECPNSYSGSWTAGPADAPGLPTPAFGLSRQRATIRAPPRFHGAGKLEPSQLPDDGQHHRRRGAAAKLVQSHDREWALEAILGSAMGLAFTVVTFGVVFGLSWCFRLFFARRLGLYAWQFGLLVAAVFLDAAVWSAWRRVDPFAGHAPPSVEQMMLTYISHMSSDFVYASPRHVTAGTAAILIGGPANLFQAVGVWRSQFRADASLINNVPSFFWPQSVKLGRFRRTTVDRMLLPVMRS
jgi:hypothetical protein